MSVEKPRQLAGCVERSVCRPERGAFGAVFQQFTRCGGIRSKNTFLLRFAFLFGAVVVVGLIGVFEPLRSMAETQTTGSSSSTSFARSFAEDSDNQSADSNDLPSGAGADGTTMWVVGDGKVFAYDMPSERAANNRLVDLQRQLVEAYAPILRMHPRETVFPTAVEMMIENAGVKNEDGEDVRNYNVTALDDYKRFIDREDHYFDLPAAAPYWLGDRTYTEYIAISDALDRDGYLTPTVYARSVVHKEILVLQYWFFYPLDRNHEGDWEMIQLEFDAGDVSGNDASGLIDLASNLIRNRIQPTRVIFSSHWLLADAECWGEADASEVQSEGLRVHVFPAFGSHANYFEPGEYDIDPRDGQRYEVLDHASANGLALVPPSYSGIIGNNRPEEMPSGVRNYAIVLLDAKTNDLSWLEFRGKWGEQTGRNNGNGPNGPKSYGVDIPSVFDVFLSERVEPWGDASTWWRVLPLGLDALECRHDNELVADSRIQRIGYKHVTVDTELDDPDDLTLKFSYAAVDKISSGLQVEIQRTDEDDSILNGVVTFGSQDNEMRLYVGGFVQYYDIGMNQAIDETVTICMKVPVGYDYIDFGVNIWHYVDRNSKWVELPTDFDRKRGDVFACAETTSFSLFALFGPGNMADSEGPSELPATGGGANVSNRSFVWTMLAGASLLFFGYAAVRVGRRIARRTR